MKIIFFILGTRGDVQPGILLAKALKDKGHQTTVLLEERMKYLAEHYDVDYETLEGDIYKTFFNGNSYRKLEKAFSIREKYDIEQWEHLNQFFLSSVGKDLIICSILSIGEAISIKEKLGIPVMPLHLIPFLPSKEYCSALPPSSDSYKSSFLNKMSHKILIKKIDKINATRLSKWRSEYLNLGAFKKNSTKDLLYNPNNININAFDPLMFINNKVPLDFKNNWKTVGFYFPQQIDIKSIPEKLISFLKSSIKYKTKDRDINNDYGKLESFTSNTEIPLTKKEIVLEEGGNDSISYKDLPIVFGLGSMPAPDIKNITSILKFTIEKLGKETKWIILNNWSNWEENFECDNVIQLDNVDHTWLFRYCSIAIIHGGIGSCGAALKCSIPSIITYLYFDQPLNAKRLKDLGTSISIDCSKLTKEKLLKSIQKIKNNYQNYKDKCLKLSTQIKPNSFEETIELIENNYQSLDRNI